MWRGWCLWNHGERVGLAFCAIETNEGSMQTHSNMLVFALNFTLIMDHLKIWWLAIRLFLMFDSGFHLQSFIWVGKQKGLTFPSLFRKPGCLNGLFITITEGLSSWLDDRGDSLLRTAFAYRYPLLKAVSVLIPVCWELKMLWEQQDTAQPHSLSSCEGIKNGRMCVRLCTDVWNITQP